MLRLNNQRPEIRAEIRYHYMIIPNAGSVTALPVFLGKLVVNSPDMDRIPIDAIVETQRYPQCIHHIPDRLFLEITGKSIL